MMKSEQYALATDGSNDEGLIKMNPLTVRYFDAAKHKVSTQLLDMCGTKKRDAETLFSKIDEVLSNAGVNCVEMGMDNTSVNLGINN